MLVTETTTLVSRASTFAQVWANIGGATAVIGVFLALFFSKLQPDETDPKGPNNQFIFRLRPNKAAMTKPLRDAALESIHNELRSKTAHDGNPGKPVEADIEMEVSLKESQI